MTRTLIAVGASLGMLLATSYAQAQAKAEFGQQGQFIFGADRLVPVFAHTQNKFTNNDVNPSTSTSTTGTGISLLWGNNSFFAGAGNIAVAGGNSPLYPTPRGGFDYVI